MKRSSRLVKGKPSKIIDSVHNAYTPDADFVEKHVAALVPKFYKTLISKAKDEKLPDLIESARIMEVNRFGAFRVRRIDSSEKFRAALNEAKKGEKILKRLVESGIKFRPEYKFSETDRVECKKLCESAKFREDFDVADNTNQTNSTDPFNEYIPIMGGPFSHQLYLHDYLDMLAKSFEAWNHNPLAHQIIKITTHFVLGRGVSFKANDQVVQDRFKEWWERNQMEERLEFWADMIARDGELMIRRFFNPVTKQMFLRWIDPSTVWEIVTDLEDIEVVYYYHQQYPTAYQVLYGAPHGSKFNPTKFDSSKYIINQIPAEEVYHVKTNCSPNEKRGRSDLFPILGWLKRFKDFQTAVVLRAIMQSTFAWKNKLSGKDTDVDAFINTFGTDQPEFGSVWVENEASDLQTMAVDTGGKGAGLADCPGIINAIAVGAGIPKEYLGLSEHGTRATAVVASEPGVKKFQARQLLLGRLLRCIADDWFHNEIATGSIPELQPGDDKDAPIVIRGLKKLAPKIPMLGDAIKRLIDFLAGATQMVPTDGNIDFMFPEIATEDRSAKMKDLQMALTDKAISHRRYATSVAKELGQEGYDYDEEMDEIVEEAQNEALSLYSPMGPSAGNPGNPPAPPAAGQPPETPEPQPAPSGSLSSEDRRGIKRNDRR